MEDDITALIDESINLELNVAGLYLLFNKLFPEDSDFWWELSFEEKNHAALIRSGKESFLPIDKFPHDLIADRLQALVDANREISSLIKKYEVNPPSRAEAFNIAFNIENSAGEIHFEKFMKKETGLKIDHIFQKLNIDDKDHANRISSYMNHNSIPLRSEKV